MSYEWRANPVFEAEMVRFLKNRPLARKDIDNALRSLVNNPKQGDRYPGIVPDLYKARWPLKSYRIGNSGGLRIVYVLEENKKCVLPISLWQKKDFADERNAIAHVKQRFKATVEALKSDKAGSLT